MSPLSVPVGCDAVEVVPRPRAADAVGAALRGAFDLSPLPDEMQRLLQRLDRA